MIHANGHGGSAHHLTVGDTGRDLDVTQRLAVDEPDLGFARSRFARRREANRGGRDAQRRRHGRRAETCRGGHAGLEREVLVVDLDDGAVGHHVLHDHKAKLCILGDDPFEGNT